MRVRRMDATFGGVVGVDGAVGDEILRRLCNLISKAKREWQWTAGERRFSIRSSTVADIIIEEF